MVNVVITRLMFQERSSSQPRQRSNSFRQPSPAPSNNGQGYSGRADWAGSLRGGAPCHAHQRTYRATTPRQRKTSRSSYRESVSPQR